MHKTLHACSTFTQVIRVNMSLFASNDHMNFYEGKSCIRETLNIIHLRFNTWCSFCDIEKCKDTCCHIFCIYVADIITLVYVAEICE